MFINLEIDELMNMEIYDFVEYEINKSGNLRFC